MSRRKITALATAIAVVSIHVPNAIAFDVSDLFFSEYVEGTSNNKAVEIYNAGVDSVDLAASLVAVRIYSNGAVTPSATIALTGIVAAGDVYVLTHSSSTPSLLALADQTSGSVSFNGNDAVVLVADGVFLDVIGQLGVDPGTQWGTAPISTLNSTIRRISTVCQGDPIGDDLFDPSIEWEGFLTDTFDGLGAHAADCTEPCIGDIAPDGGDGSVGVPDLLAIINAWGACGDPRDCPADIAPPGGDDSVGVPDLLAIINNWGSCDP